MEKHSHPVSKVGYKMIVFDISDAMENNLLCLYPGYAELSECLMTKLFPVPGWKFVNCPILVVRGEREDAG